MTSHRRIGVRLACPVLAALAMSACAIDEETSARHGSTGRSTIQTDSRNGEHPPPDDLAAELGCDTTDQGRARASGAVTNHSSGRSVYDVTVSFQTLDGVEFAEGHAQVNELSSGQTATWETVVNNEVPATFRCEITHVNRYSA